MFTHSDFMKPGHDQYVYRHANGLCVIGLAKTHVALQAQGGVTSVDFNVGKSDRSELKVSGKRKKNAQHFQPNSILCNVHSGDVPYTVRCCVKGPLLEVNNKLIESPDLLNTSDCAYHSSLSLNLNFDFSNDAISHVPQAEREGYIAIVMPRPGDWLKIKETLVDFDEFKKLRNLS
uniref:Protein Abitram n=1 Tax=Chenopodium quinoa TaxID=63459 RepID=A0A803LST5_CHEQI